MNKKQRYVLFFALLIMFSFARIATALAEDGPIGDKTGGEKTCQIISNCYLYPNVSIQIDIKDEATQKFLFVGAEDQSSLLLSGEPKPQIDEFFYNEYKGGPFLGTYNYFALDSDYVNLNGGLVSLINTSIPIKNLTDEETWQYQNDISGYPKNINDFNQHKYEIYVVGVKNSGQDETKLYPFNPINQPYEIEDLPNYDQYQTIKTYPEYAVLGIGYAKDGNKEVVLYLKDEYVYGQNNPADGNIVLSYKQFDKPQIFGLVQNISDLKTVVVSPTVRSTASPVSIVPKNQSFWHKILNFFANIFR